MAKTIKFPKKRIDLNSRHLTLAGELISHAYEDLKNDVEMTKNNLRSLRMIRDALRQINVDVKTIGRTRK